MHKREVANTNNGSSAPTPSTTATTTLEEGMNNSVPLKYYEPVNKSSTSLHLQDDSLSMLSPNPNTLTFQQRLRSFFQAHSGYFWGLLYRISSLIVILGVLIAIGIGLRYTDDMPKSEDFSKLTFDWKVNPRDYLTPYNTTFQYNILMNGHAHSTYSDGKMNVRQLLQWHLG